MMSVVSRPAHAPKRIGDVPPAPCPIAHATMLIEDAAQTRAVVSNAYD